MSKSCPSVGFCWRVAQHCISLSTSGSCMAGSFLVERVELLSLSVLLCSPLPSGCFALVSPRALRSQFGTRAQWPLALLHRSDIGASADPVTQLVGIWASQLRTQRDSVSSRLSRPRAAYKHVNQGNRSSAVYFQPLHKQGSSSSSLAFKL